MVQTKFFCALHTAKEKIMQTRTSNPSHLYAVHSGLRQEQRLGPCKGRGGLAVCEAATVSSRQVCSFSSQTDRRILKECRSILRPPMNKLLATSFTMLQGTHAYAYKHMQKHT